MSSISEMKVRLIRPKTVLSLIIAVLLLIAVSIPFWDISMTLRGQSSQIETYLYMFYILFGIIIFLLLLSMEKVYGIEVPEINEREEIVLITRRSKFERHARSYEWKWPFEIMRKYYRKFHVTCNVSVKSKLFNKATVNVSGNFNARCVDFLLQFDDGYKSNSFTEERVKEILGNYTINIENQEQKYIKAKKEGSIRELLVTSFIAEEIPVFGVEVEIVAAHFNY